jgi:uncharacterized surface protein with fasciclin (FAS1) repeats
MRLGSSIKVVLFAGALSLAGTGSIWAGEHGLGKKADIVETATNAGSFNTLVSAVKAAGLVETLKGEGPFTVFAPTDEAFAKLPAGTLDALLKDKAKLTRILTYHVVPGRVMARDVTGLKSAKTVAGPELRIDSSVGVKINDASVVKADIETSNGVIHVIDTVLIPSETAHAE